MKNSSPHETARRSGVALSVDTSKTSAGARGLPCAALVSAVTVDFPIAAKAQT